MAGKDSWPAFRTRAEAILAEVVTADVAGELAGMLAEVADNLRPAWNAPQGMTWPQSQTWATSGAPAAWSWTVPSPTQAAEADPDDLTEEERRGIAERFAEGDCCGHCGGIHMRACPRVRRLVFHAGKNPDGSGDIAEVEFWADGQWPERNILWPEDFPPDGRATS